MLLADCALLFKKYKPVNIPTVYIGGGTPSILGAKNIYHLTKGISGLIYSYTGSKPFEFTIEANPESANEAFLEAARKGGATRLSLGVQTFYGPSRLSVNRSHEDSSNGEAFLFKQLNLAKTYFPNSLSVDLISGLPFQTENIILQDINNVLEFTPAHVSLYSLTVEPGTKLAERVGEKTFFSADKTDNLWLAGKKALEEAGYLQYEVSNFCLKGKESLHNIRYWQMLNWFALGPSSSGTVICNKTGSGLRYTTTCVINIWQNRKKGEGPSLTVEKLDKITLIKESFLMGFRYIEGPDEMLFKQRFGQNINDIIPKTLTAWKRHLQKDKYALTKEGLLFLNSFLIDAFMEIG
jgi:oxygen-independent coproporphyrinogen-3 oxidase